MIFKVTQDTNFCRVFELPPNYPEGFCFGGGKPVMFKLVDWFNPVDQQLVGSKEVTLEGEELEVHRHSLYIFLRDQQYIDPTKCYICITDYGDSLVIQKEY